MRYQRQIALPEMGQEGQLRLQQARILCVGAGGLGSPVLLYLAGAGVGRIGVMDADKVALHNLQRQVLYTEADVGKIKSTTAISHLLALNHDIRYDDFPEFIHHDNALERLSVYDFILDCTDSIQAKLLLNDACHQLQKPLISASVEAFRGQLITILPPNNGCLRCLFPELTQASMLTRCETSGVLGVVPGILGMHQALVVLKWILQLEEKGLGQVYHFDALSQRSANYQLEPNPSCILCTKKQNFATLWGKDLAAKGQLEKHMQSHQITVQELAQKLNNQESFFLLDVRNPDEHAQFNIGGHLVPLTLLPESLAQIPDDMPIVIYCRSGHRSQLALEFLQQQGFSDVKNLIGGVLAWQQAG
ncbi:ThiF family adenylyltransferase [Candidatus Berkiella aquae]|uniref:HesA/MoeB/ThiF family protein n=1 Tax=Candidatus Berkiella aquae TaxID=295108 RepID=A0A0Q9Z137_9GAMM|nr:HesA/MoeB/ThiF family protein [Candidatus Berkiella aquae]MCS5712602.1 HesA/MoeB/ThiF family protein [Candidatus Berkiella aquae]